MTPISPVISNEHQHREIVYPNFDQPEYLQLPAYLARDPMGHVITRWKLSWRERWAVFFGGSI